MKSNAVRVDQSRQRAGQAPSPQRHRLLLVANSQGRRALGKNENRRQQPSHQESAVQVHPQRHHDRQTRHPGMPTLPPSMQNGQLDGEQQKGKQLGADHEPGLQGENHGSENSGSYEGMKRSSSRHAPDDQDNRQPQQQFAQQQTGIAQGVIDEKKDQFAQPLVIDPRRPVGGEGVWIGAPEFTGLPVIRTEVNVTPQVRVRSNIGEFKGPEGKHPCQNSTGYDMAFMWSLPS